MHYHDQKIHQTSTHDIQEHWTAVSTLLGLISSVYRNLHHWRSNQQPQIAVPKLYNWATSSYRTQVMPNKLVMVIARPNNQNVSCKLHPYSSQMTRSPHQGHIFPKSLEIRICVIIIPQGRGNRCTYFFFLSRGINIVIWITNSQY